MADALRGKFQFRGMRRMSREEGRRQLAEDAEKGSALREYNRIGQQTDSSDGEGSKLFVPGSGAVSDEHGDHRQEASPRVSGVHFNADQFGIESATLSSLPAQHDDTAGRRTRFTHFTGEKTTSSHNTIPSTDVSTSPIPGLQLPGPHADWLRLLASAGYDSWRDDEDWFSKPELYHIRERFPIKNSCAEYPVWKFDDPNRMHVKLKVLRDGSWRHRHDCTFKILVIGDIAVGKTNLISRFAKDEFTAGAWPTLGVRVESVDVAVDKEVLTQRRRLLGRHKKAEKVHHHHVVRMQFWDVSGQLELSRLDRSVFERVAGILYVYNITDDESFVHLMTLLTECELRYRTHPLCMLLGNKADLESCRAVSCARGEHCATDHGMLFLETSGREAMLVPECFLLLCSRIEECAHMALASKQLNVWHRQKTKRTKRFWQR